MDYGEWIIRLAAVVGAYTVLQLTVLKLAKFVLTLPKVTETKLGQWYERRRQKREEADTLQFIANQLRPNGGSTIFDKVNEVAAKQATGFEKITERLDHVSAIQEAALDASESAVWQADENGFHTSINHRFEEILKCTIEDIRGTNWKNIVHIDDLPRVASTWESAVREGRTYKTTHRIYTGDKQLVTIFSQANPMRDSLKKITGWFGTIRVLAEATVPVILPSHGRKLLWVDDNPDDLERIATYFKLHVHGVIIHTTPTGGDAVQRYKAALDIGHPFDTVVLDQMMPGMSGIEVAKSIRDIERVCHHHARIAFCSGAVEGLPQAELARLEVTKLFKRPYEEREVAAWVKGDVVDLPFPASLR